MSGRFGPQFEHIFGSGDIEKLFPDEAPSTVTPWGQAGGLRSRHDYEKDKVMEAVKQPHLTDIDPRTVKATQPFITRAGVRHYLTAPEGSVYKDAHLLGNQHPVVYHRPDASLLLSGHHRAAAALLQGKQFRGIEVHGDYGPPR